jgi:predicted  nucleic acid-binding Zn-ribbon protein
MSQSNPQPNKRPASGSTARKIDARITDGCPTCGHHTARRYAQADRTGRRCRTYKCASCQSPIAAGLIVDHAIEATTANPRRLITDGGTAVDQPTDSETTPDDSDLSGRHRPDFDTELGVPPVFESVRDAEMYAKIDSASGTETIRHTDEGWQARHRRTDGEVVDKVFDLDVFALQQRARQYDEITVITPRQTTIRFDDEEA